MKSNKKSTYQELEKQVAELKAQNEFLLKSKDSKLKDNYKRPSEASLKTERTQSLYLLNKSETKYKDMFNSRTDMFQILELIYDKDGKPIDCYYREVNPAFEKLTGKTRAQLVNKRIRDLFSLEDYWLDIYQKVITTGKYTNFEDYGAEFDHYYMGVCWKVDHNKVAVIFTNITEQKQKEKALEKALEKADEKIVKQNIALQKLNTNDLLVAKDRFNLYFEYLPSPMAIYRLEKDGQLIFEQVNLRLTTLLGIDPNTIVGTSYVDVFPSKKNSQAHKMLRSIALGEFKSQKFIDHYQDKDRSIWSEVTYFNLGENIVGAVSFDISEQKRAEIALDKSDNEYKMLFDSMTEMVGIIELIYDTKGKPIDFYYRDVNQSFANLNGKPKDQLINKKASTIVGTIEANWLTAFAGVDKTGVATNFENYGAEFDKYYSVSAWKTAKNQVGVTFADITAKRRSEERKAETKLLLDKIKKDTNDTQKLASLGSWIFNVATNAAEWSDEMFNIWGFDSEKGTPDHDSIIKQIHADDLELYNWSLANATDQGIPYNIEFRIRNPNGQQKTIRAICKPIFGDSAKVISFSGTNQDITQQKLFEKELVNLERLQAMGEMSASIAHDFNNSLQEMSGNLEILKLQRNLSDSSIERITSIRSIITDVATRVNALQNFGDTAHYSKKAELINFNAVVKDSLKESRPLWKDNMEKSGLTIAITTHFKDIPDVNCNLGELKSVIYNLIKNSIEALPKGGDIVIETGTKAEGVFITFTDTGLGMDEETKLKVFQPFFSTKGFELGRGLGMSGAYSIIKKHKGTIAVKFSELGKGTTIEIVFPIGEQEENKDLSDHKPEPKVKDAFRVLWVDDDTTIRENSSELLELIGHKCDSVNSGKHALDYLSKNTCDIVFTDIGMPEMNGWQLADAIRKSFGNNIKIVVVTGWYVDEKTKNEHHVDFVLQKPFSMEALEKTLRTIAL